MYSSTSITHTSPGYHPGIPSSDEPPEEPFDADRIASEWRKLASMDQYSPDFLPLLSALVAGTDTSPTTRLRGEKAKLALDALDKVFWDNKIPDDHERDTRSVMRRLAYNSGQIPPRYRIEAGAFSVSDDVIANGSFSDIRRGMLNGKAVAVRTLRQAKGINAQDTQKLFCKECIIWMSASHPHLLQLIGVDIDPLSGRCSMISEMMKGNIKDYISKNSANRLRLLSHAAAGLQYLHRRGIVHGDVKGRNILITNEKPPRACLADFGLSTLIPGAQQGGSTMTVGGTPLYMAPELLAPARFGQDCSRPTQPADVYAFAMVIYEVLTGLDPFYDLKLGSFEIVVHVLDGKRPAKPSNADGIGFGGGTWELVKECWRKQSTKRPAIERVLQQLERVSASSAVVGPTEILQADPRALLRRWRGLASLDPGSADHQLLTTLVDDEENRDITLTFRGKDATTVVNTIDRVLKESRVPDKTKLRAFNLLQKLAGDSRQVPKSYLVGLLTSYKVEKTIFARGGFSDIRQGRLKGTAVAVKTVRARANVGAMHETFCRECVLWMNISHPNVLRLLAVEIKPKTGRFSMISEMMVNGNITNYIRVNKANRLLLLGDVSKGLEYLHEYGVIHGDLKGSNILIDNQTPPRACISDFGCSAIAQSASPDSDAREDVGGTFGYMAPELFQEDANPSKEADVYAFGMVVYEVVTGVHPFRGYKAMELPMLTTQGLRPTEPEDPAEIGFGLGTWEFIQRCWDGDCGKRPLTRETREHFNSLAETSKIVDAGPIPWTRSEADGAPTPEDDSVKSFSQLFVPGNNTTERTDSIFSHLSRLYTRTPSIKPSKDQRLLAGLI